MADEIIDIFNEHNIPANQRVLKSRAHTLGLWHRTAHVWLYRPNGQVLLQLRSPGKDLYPRMWDISAAGHVGAGETPEHAAVRELHEELGIRATNQELVFWGVKTLKTTYKEFINNEHSYVYGYRFTESLDTLNLQTVEVQEVRFFTPTEMRQSLYESSVGATLDVKLVPHGEYWEWILQKISSCCLS